MKEPLTRLLTSLTAKYVAVFVLLVAVPALAVAAYTLLFFIRPREARPNLASAGEGTISRVERESVARGHRGTARIDPSQGLSPLQVEDALNPLRRDRALPQPRVPTAGAGRSLRLGMSTSSSRGRPSRLEERNGLISLRPLSVSQTPIRRALRTDIAAGDPVGSGVVAESFVPVDAFAELMATRLGRAGYAFAVDTHGRLLAHPDDEAMRRFRRAGGSLRSLDQVEEALTSASGSGSAIGRTSGGKRFSPGRRLSPSVGRYLWSSRRAPRLPRFEALCGAQL